MCKMEKGGAKVESAELVVSANLAWSPTNFILLWVTNRWALWPIVCAPAVVCRFACLCGPFDPYEAEAARAHSSVFCSLPPRVCFTFVSAQIPT